MTDEVFAEVMVTAHRRLPRDASGWLNTAICEVLAKLRQEYGMQRATTGMAPGGDQLFGRGAQDCDIPLRAAIPYPDQPLDGTDGHFGPKWTKQQIADWHTLRGYAEGTGSIHYVSTVNPRSFDERVRMLHARNDWMLEHTAAVVAIWAPANLKSGTASCLRKAASVGKPIILVNLATQAVTRPLPQHWARYLNIPALARQR
jgi:hypothetical protein